MFAIMNIKSVDSKSTMVGVMSFFIILFYFILLFRATPTAYADSQARGQSGAIATGLYHSHSNAGPNNCR